MWYFICDDHICVDKNSRKGRWVSCVLFLPFPNSEGINAVRRQILNRDLCLFFRWNYVLGGFAAGIGMGTWRKSTQAGWFHGIAFGKFQIILCYTHAHTLNSSIQFILNSQLLSPPSRKTVMTMVLYGSLKLSKRTEKFPTQPNLELGAPIIQRDTKSSDHRSKPHKWKHQSGVDGIRTLTVD